MFNILKQAIENAPEVVVQKRSLIQTIKGMYKSYMGKRKYQALALAKREEKAALAKANNEKADKMDAEAEQLIQQSIMVKCPDQRRELMDEAVALSIVASELRHN